MGDGARDSMRRERWARPEWATARLDSVCARWRSDKLQLKAKETRKAGSLVAGGELARSALATYLKNVYLGMGAVLRCSRPVRRGKHNNGRGWDQ
jgi:hypothetical protein